MMINTNVVDRILSCVSYTINSHNWKHSLFDYLTSLSQKTRKYLVLRVKLRCDRRVKFIDADTF